MFRPLLLITLVLAAPVSAQDTVLVRRTAADSILRTAATQTVRHHNRIGRTALIGGLIGAGVGAVAGAALAPDCSGQWICFGPEIHAIFGAGVGALGGATVGVIVGVVINSRGAAARFSVPVRFSPRGTER